MIRNEMGADFDAIYNGITHNYPRASVILPDPDSRPVRACSGHDAACFVQQNQLDRNTRRCSVNEDWPQYRLSPALLQEVRFRAICSKAIGNSRNAFKAGSRRSRDSLSYKLKSLLELETGTVLCPDP